MHDGCWVQLVAPLFFPFLGQYVCLFLFLFWRKGQCVCQLGLKDVFGPASPVYSLQPRLHHHQTQTQGQAQARFHVASSRLDHSRPPPQARSSLWQRCSFYCAIASASRLVSASAGGKRLFPSWASAITCRSSTSKQPALSI
jgi:hypothetical protein